MLLSVFILSTIAYFRYCMLSTGNRVDDKSHQDDFFYKLLVILIALILICFTGLRYRTGADYGNYMTGYYVRKLKWLDYVLALNEPVFSVICKIASVIYDDYVTMFLLTASIIITLYMKQIYKYSTDILTSVMLFVLAGPLIGSMGALRQYLAAAVLFAGHKYVVERKFCKYMGVVFIAFLCHTTALIMIPVYFLCKLKINYKSILLLALSSTVIIYSFDFLFTIMSAIKGSDQTVYAYMNTQVNILRVLVTFAPVILYLLTYKIPLKNDREHYYIMMLFVNAALMFSTSNSAYLARIGIYTEAFVVFGYPVILRRFDYQSRVILKIVIYGLFLIYFYNQINISELNNYQTIFSR